MDFYPDYDDVFDPDWFIDQLPPDDINDDGVLGEDPFKEDFCKGCGRILSPENWCICPEHVWNTVPF